MMIGETIQLSMAPAFLLVATGAILNVVTGRLARVVDRARYLQERHAETGGLEHDRLVKELRRLDRRMDVINWSILLCVACGIVVCLLVAMLFIGGTAHDNSFQVAIAAAFILAMVLLLSGLIFFLVEVRLAIRTIHVPIEMLEQEGRERRLRLRLPGRD